jgi:hypothetical protein
MIFDSTDRADMREAVNGLAEPDEWYDPYDWRPTDLHTFRYALRDAAENLLATTYSMEWMTQVSQGFTIRNGNTRYRVEITEAHRANHV